MVDQYDIVFIGHLCYDEIQPYLGMTVIAPGSAVMWGAVVAGRMGKETAAVVRISPRDESLLDTLTSAGVDVYAVPSPETSYSRIVHLSPNPDEREFSLVHNAGKFSLIEVPKLSTGWLVLAGISDQEFDLDLIEDLCQRGHRLALDWQSFVRQADPLTGAITLRDVPEKEWIAGCMACVKLDASEALALTGTEDPFQAAESIASWGCPEGIITRAEGAVAWANGEIYSELFTHRSSAGRTGRGDTAFAAYLARRLDHDPEESLRFSAALTSIKLEKPYPFSGTLESVLQRMEG